MSKCINCGYFLNCKEADQGNTNCKKYEYREKVHTKWFINDQGELVWDYYIK